MNQPNVQGQQGASSDPNQDPNQNPQGEGQGQGQGDDAKSVPIHVMHRERDKAQNLQAQLDAMKQVMGDQGFAFDASGNPVPLNDNRQQQQQTGPQNVNQNFQRVEQLWQEDPKQATRTEISAAISWYDQIQSEIEGQEAAIAKEAPDYNKLRGDVRKYIRSLPIEERGKKGVVKRAFNAVRGSNIDDIIKEREQELKKKYEQSDTATGLGQGTSTGPAKPQEKELNADQKKAAAAMGISEENYKKGFAK